MWVDMFPMDMPAPGPQVDISARKPKRYKSLFDCKISGQAFALFYMLLMVRYWTILIFAFRPLS